MRSIHNVQLDGGSNPLHFPIPIYYTTRTVCPHKPEENMLCVVISYWHVACGTPDVNKRAHSHSRQLSVYRKLRSREHVKCTCQ